MNRERLIDHEHKMPGEKRDQKIKYENFSL